MEFGDKRARDAGDGAAGDRGHGGAESRANAYLEERRRARDEAIEKLVRDAESRGYRAAKVLWSMVYDFEVAGRTTNRAQLDGMGIVVPRPSEVNDVDVTAKLWELLHGLARLGVYLLNTDHLSDRELYDQLVQEVIEEDVPDIVTRDETREWIDLGTYVAAAAEEDKSFEWPLPAVVDRDAHLPRPPRRFDSPSKPD